MAISEKTKILVARQITQLEQQRASLVADMEDYEGKISDIVSLIVGIDANIAALTADIPEPTIIES